MNDLCPGTGRTWTDDDRCPVCNGRAGALGLTTYHGRTTKVAKRRKIARHEPFDYSFELPMHLDTIVKTMRG